MSDGVSEGVTVIVGVNEGVRLLVAVCVGVRDCVCEAVDVNDAVLQPVDVRDGVCVMLRDCVCESDCVWVRLGVCEDEGVPERLGVPLDDCVRDCVCVIDGESDWEKVVTGKVTLAVAESFPIVHAKFLDDCLPVAVTNGIAVDISECLRDDLAIHDGKCYAISHQPDGCRRRRASRPHDCVCTDPGQSADL